MALKAQFNMGPYQNIFLFKIAHAKLIKSLYLLRCLLLAVVLEVGVVEVHEGDPEGPDQHGIILKQFLIQNCTYSIYKHLMHIASAIWNKKLF